MASMTVMFGMTVIRGVSAITARVLVSTWF